jgi:hypothetical protein
MGSVVVMAFRTLSASPAEGPCLRSAGEAVVLTVEVGLYHSTSPPKPEMQMAGRRVGALTGLSTVNSADRNREGVVGVFVRLAIVGSDVAAMIWEDTRLESWMWWGFEFTAVGWVAVSGFYSAWHVTFPTPPSEGMQLRT